MVSVLKAMKAKSYKKFSVHSASQDRLFQGLVTDFQVRLTQNPFPHCSAQHVSHISEPQLPLKWGFYKPTDFPCRINKFSESPWQGLSQNCLLSGFLWVQVPVSPIKPGRTRTSCTGKNEDLTWRTSSEQDEGFLRKRCPLSQSIFLWCHLYRHNIQDMSPHLPLSNRPLQTLAGNTLHLWFCTHWFVSPFPRILPGCRWPWASLERPTIPLKYSLSECELLRMWHCERFRKIPLHSATGMQSRKSRDVLWVEGGRWRYTRHSQEKTVMHYGQFW